MSFKYQDKVVWITGASSGIGEALAVEFSKQGAVLVLSARRVEELERVKDRTLRPETVFIHPLDLSDIESLELKTQQVIDRFGRIDVLIHNGGISHRTWGYETSVELVRKVFEVNFFSYVALTKLVLPYFIEQGEGQIGVMSSLAGKVGLKKRCAYSASKHALLGYFNTLRNELHDQNIKVTVFCPGAVQTNIAYHALLKDGVENKQIEASIENGITAELFAKQAIKGLEKNKREVFNRGKDQIVIIFFRLFPTLFYTLLRNRSYFF